MPVIAAARSLGLQCLIWITLVFIGTSAWSSESGKPRVDVFHWWVSGGERLGMDAIRDMAQARGIGWSETSTVGSGTDRYTKVLEARIRSGNTPTAAQMIGFSIHAWAAKDVLANLDDLAQREEWDAVYFRK